MPKLAALQASESVGLLVARPVALFGRAAGPLIRLMNGSSGWFLRRLGYRDTGDEGEVHTVDELRLLVEDSEEAGEIDPDAADMVLNVFGLADKKVWHRQSDAVQPETHQKSRNVRRRLQPSGSSI